MAYGPFQYAQECLRVATHQCKGPAPCLKPGPEEGCHSVPRLLGPLAGAILRADHTLAGTLLCPS